MIIITLLLPPLLLLLLLLLLLIIKIVILSIINRQLGNTVKHEIIVFSRFRIYFFNPVLVISRHVDIGRQHIDYDIAVFMLLFRTARAVKYITASI